MRKRYSKARRKQRDYIRKWEEETRKAEKINKKLDEDYKSALLRD